MNDQLHKPDGILHCGTYLIRTRMGLLCLMGVLLAGQSVWASSLAENSPFIPPNTPPPSPNTPSAPPPEAQNLAFRGVYSLNGVSYFNIFDKRQNKGAWVKEGDPTAQYEVTGFDEANMNVKLKLGGTDAELALDKPTWVSMPVQMAQPVATQPGQPGVQAGGSSASAPPRPPPPPRRRIVRPTTSQNAQANVPTNIPKLPEELRNFVPPPPPSFTPPSPPGSTGSDSGQVQEGANPVHYRGSPPNFVPPPPPNK